MVDAVVFSADGVGYVVRWRRSMNPIGHAIYKLRNAQIHQYPFPHFYATDVFPDDFYEALVASLPEDDGYAPLQGGYASRTAAIAPNPLVAGMEGQEFATHVLSLFPKPFNERFAYGKARFRTECRFIRDSEGYQIGPHTDAPAKVVSLLFYLPTDFDLWEHGTGIFVPEDGEKTCRGGPHYKFDGFKEVWRAPFTPNSCFGFWKTSNSWHGVEKISQISRKIRRDVLLYNIYADDDHANQQGTIPG